MSKWLKNSLPTFWSFKYILSRIRGDTAILVFVQTFLREDVKNLDVKAEVEDIAVLDEIVFSL